MLKKVIAPLTFCIIFLLSGCVNSSFNSSINIITNFDACMSVTVNDKEFNCMVSTSDVNYTRIEINEPEEIAGLTYEYSGAYQSIKFKDHEIDSSEQYLPDSAFAQTLVDILSTCVNMDNLDKKYSTNDVTEFTGNCDEGKFKLYINSDGFINKISVDENDLEYNFSNMEETKL